MNSKNASTQKTVARQLSNKSHGTYLGLTPKGAIKIMMQERTAFGRGTLYEYREKNRDGKIVPVRVRKHKTPLAPSTEAQTKVHLVCEKTGKQLLLIGGIKWPKKKSDSKIECVEIVSSSLKRSQSVSNNQISFEVGQGHSSPGLKSRAPKKSSELSASDESQDVSTRSQTRPQVAATPDIKAELSRIAAQMEAGITPYIKLYLVCFLTGESRANIYRKIRIGDFPAPTKRGKSSFWPLPIVEAYKSGTWRGKN